MNRQHGQAGDLFNPDIRCTLDGFQHGLNIIGRCEQLIQIVAKYLDAKIGAHTGNQLVKAHLDGLGKLVFVAGNLLYCGLHFHHQFCPGFARVWPLVTRFEHHKIVRNAGRHGIGRHFRGADLGHHFVHLGKRLDAHFQLLLHGDGLFQPCTGYA